MGEKQRHEKRVMIFAFRTAFSLSLYAIYMQLERSVLVTGLRKIGTVRREAARRSRVTSRVFLRLGLFCMA